ncbi:MAG: acetate kinase [Deltaproteobacteria bacterium]|nr:acetate kinase [Deltaproteobacteria bacterium]
MYVLIINAGSSSVKFTLFKKDDLQIVIDGIVERIGLKGTKIHTKNAEGKRVSKETHVADTRKAVGIIADLMTDKNDSNIQPGVDIAGIGHRVVHGGEMINNSVVVDDRVKQIVKECFELAPLHNPPNLEGIEACEDIFPGVPQVAVFDTAFHTTLPEYAYLYGLPYALYKEDKIRRYGFHGTSHQYVCRTAADFLGRPLKDLKIISCHLGNGCSITAIDGGRSVDTSMGFTPLEGLMMGTRCGDLDPAIVFYLMEHKHLDLRQINELLNKQSGLLGLAGIGSSDLRDIFEASESGNRQTDTAVGVFTYRIKKYIGAYAFALGGIDAVVFTAGIGENSPGIRKMVCRGLERLGIVMDTEKNVAGNLAEREIQHNDSRVKILVIPTNEEKQIALQTLELLHEER